MNREDGQQDSPSGTDEDERDLQDPSAPVEEDKVSGEDLNSDVPGPSGWIDPEKCIAPGDKDVFASPKKTTDSVPVTAEYIEKHMTVVKEMGVGRFGYYRLMQDVPRNELLILKYQTECPTNEEENILKEVLVIEKLSGKEFFLKYFGHVTTGEKPVTHIIVMEYFESERLTDFVSIYKLTPSIIRFIIYQAASGIHYMHTEAHVLHRDIRPDNMLVNVLAKLKIIEFGLSCIGISSKQWVGTISYIAPEVHICGKGKHKDLKTPYGPPADFYSLGVVAYFLHFRTTPTDFYYEHQTDTFNILREQKNEENRHPVYGITFPSHLEKLTGKFLSKLLRKNPHVRLYGKDVFKDDYFDIHQLEQQMKIGIPCEKIEEPTN